MNRYQAYFGSLLRQIVAVALLMLPLGILGVISGGDVDFSYFPFVISWMYFQVTFDLLVCLFKPNMTPELFSLYTIMGLLFRIIVSLLLALASIRGKFRYAIIAEVVVSIISITLFIISSIQ